MADQQYCLRWNNHQTTLVSIFDTLLQRDRFTDCTISAEGQSLAAHKILLTACSPYFEAVLSQIRYDRHPVIILKDVTFAELKALMDYMYRGEVNISQDQLAALLKVAESLQIKGLSDSGEKEKPEKRPPPLPQQPAPSVPRSSGLTVEHSRRSNQAQILDLPSDSPLNRHDGNVSPVPRKRKRPRRRSSGDDSSLGQVHPTSMTESLDSSNSREPIAASIPQNVSALLSKTAVIPEPRLHDHDLVLPDALANVDIPKIEPPTELDLLQPKEEYVDDNDDVDHITLDDDDDDMDLSQQAGPSHGGEGSSSQGYPPSWHQASDRSNDEVFMAAQEAVGGAQRDSQVGSTVDCRTPDYRYLLYYGHEDQLSVNAPEGATVEELADGSSPLVVFPPGMTNVLPAVLPAPTIMPPRGDVASAAPSPRGSVGHSAARLAAVELFASWKQAAGRMKAQKATVRRAANRVNAAPTLAARKVWHRLLAARKSSRRNCGARQAAGVKVNARTPDEEEQGNSVDVEADVNAQICTVYGNDGYEETILLIEDKVPVDINLIPYNLIPSIVSSSPGEGGDGAVYYDGGDGDVVWQLNKEIHPATRDREDLGSDSGTSFNNGIMHWEEDLISDSLGTRLNNVINEEMHREEDDTSTGNQSKTKMTGGDLSSAINLSNNPPNAVHSVDVENNESDDSVIEVVNIDSSGAEDLDQVDSSSDQVIKKESCSKVVYVIRKKKPIEEVTILTDEDEGEQRVDPRAEDSDSLESAGAVMTDSGYEGTSARSRALSGSYRRSAGLLLDSVVSADDSAAGVFVTDTTPVVGREEVTFASDDVPRGVEAVPGGGDDEVDDVGGGKDDRSVEDKEGSGGVAESAERAGVAGRTEAAGGNEVGVVSDEDDDEDDDDEDEDDVGNERDKGTKYMGRGGQHFYLYDCCGCDRTFSSRARVRHHMQRCHALSAPVYRSRRTRCKVYYRTDAPRTVLSCSLCAFKTLDKWDLSRHIMEGVCVPLVPQGRTLLRPALFQDRPIATGNRS